LGSPLYYHYYVEFFLEKQDFNSLWDFFLHIFFLYFSRKNVFRQLSAQGPTEEGIAATRANVETRPVIIERNVLRADVLVPPFNFIDQLI
jgi:hypothetical protein